LIASTSLQVIVVISAPRLKLPPTGDELIRRVLGICMKETSKTIRGIMLILASLGAVCGGLVAGMASKSASDSNWFINFALGLLCLAGGFCIIWIPYWVVANLFIEVPEEEKDSKASQ
jgi:hypothetical protein